MSGDVKGLELDEASMRLLSRLGDARFELTNGTRERAYAEVVAAEVDASEVTEALAKTRVSEPPLPLPPSYQVLARQRDQYKRWWLEAKGQRNKWMDRAAEHGARELALRDQVADLSDALEAYYVRHKCGCNHPACNDCDRDKTAEAALAKARREMP